MTLMDKLNVRAGTLWFLYNVFRPSMWIVAYMAISAMKFYNYGLGMYQGHHFPKTMSLPDYIDTFVRLSITPVIWWLPVAMLVEHVVISPLYAKYVVSRARNSKLTPC